MNTLNTIITLADAARSFAGADLTRTQLKVIRARLRRHQVTAQVATVTNPATEAVHYAVTIGTPVHVAIGLRAF